MYRKIYLCPYDDDVSEISNAPDIGNKIIGNKDVAAIGIASVIHQTAIHKVEAKTALPSSDNPSKSTKSLVTIKRIGPKKNPIFFAFN